MTPETQSLRRERGLWWPASDVECAAKVFDQAADLDAVIALCPKRRTVVQAGGNAGLWPCRLAQQFGSVYTFEPVSENFHALCMNAAFMPNVFIARAALGYERGGVALENVPQNCGAGFINGIGNVPVIRIDDLALAACDLIYLDIEGSELDALRGAQETIARCRPLVALEEKGLGKRFGKRETAPAWLARTCGYREVARFHKDVVMQAVA